MYQNELDEQREAAIWLRREAGGNVSLTKLGGYPRCRLKSSGRANAKPTRHSIFWRRLIYRSCHPLPSTVLPMRRCFR